MPSAALVDPEEVVTDGRKLRSSHIPPIDRHIRNIQRVATEEADAPGSLRASIVHDCSVGHAEGKVVPRDDYIDLRDQQLLVDSVYFSDGEFPGATSGSV